MFYELAPSFALALLQVSPYETCMLRPTTNTRAEALVLYEHVITIRLEVQQIWKRGLSGATVLFILTRYITLINRLLISLSLSSLQSTKVRRSIKPMSVLLTHDVEVRILTTRCRLSYAYLPW